MAQVGSRGKRLDIIARQGSTIGPFIVDLVNPDDSPVNLTGCTITGQIRKNALDTLKVADLTIVVLDPLVGKFSFEILHSVSKDIPAGEFQRSVESVYQWDMELLDTLNKISPLYYAEYLNFREVTRP